ncbi:deoxyribose-phosphate aldolase [Pectinatus haikarae]|uniref:Deoxyribose-phosphate aldolase n=1 Tax=Pectinatus haikarae TaxID=349096 RepID=A0ABT9Y5B7_9FIRM|nr:deoxyribose-phosphate aldolase [Pectinatus haikarae]MDQ0203031.1 deoxyribose-phosphate aldolase [Pectinatus haikarae]
MDYAKLIDHTLLKTDAVKKDLEKLLIEAKKYNFASVCISPIWVSDAYEQLKNTNIAVCTVIGFPQGATPTSVKVFETEQAIKDGASEIDMVIAIGKLKDCDDKYVKNDISAVVKATKGKAIVKVIIEACLLSDSEKVRACNLAVEAGASFVKTSTGFSIGGATEKDVALMKKTVNGKAKVKAAGGIRSRQDADIMIAAGAERIGTSHGVEIVN